jgi:hypothetical protein
MTAIEANPTPLMSAGTGALHDAQAQQLHPLRRQPRK